ncbi:myeloperoxidase-like [Sphaerodactylus townsendi]|uniref:myeloperoxidase-like n=1 Tax=Sphaerodactylus townsendi TaxID=933632 RepID=UPI002026DC30|nr:myeloperoxidase-like [Sphaerodactylus townsendi]
MAGMSMFLSLLGLLVAVKQIQTADPSIQDVTGKLGTTTLLQSVKEAKRQVDADFKQTQESLQERLANGTLSPADLLALSRQPSGKSKQAVKAANYLDVTLDLLKERLKEEIPGDFKLQDVLTSSQKQTIFKATGCAQQEKVTCDHEEESPYRTITGKCNNIRNPLWGVSNQPYARWLPQEYEDGISVPRGWTENKLYSGFPLPLVRAVSNEIVSFPNDDFTEDQQRSVMFMQWGQFVAHDLDLGLAEQTKDCRGTCDKDPPCFPIKLPASDPRNRSCLPFTQAARVCDSDFAARNQINVITSFLDASLVYGNDDKMAEVLRSSSGDGLMDVNRNFTDKGLAFLPFRSSLLSGGCIATDPENKIPCFLAGDFRADEMPDLTVLHTVFLREHNRLATELKRLNPQWGNEILYQEARKIVVAELQKITYRDYLPELLGPVSGSTLKHYWGYNSSVDPRISSVFTNGFRFGHTTVRPTVNRLDARYQLVSQMPLRKQFLAPWSVLKQGGIDPLLRGMLAKPAKLFKQDQFVVEGLRNHLFEQGGIGMDLPSMNMQRGRDHGLPGYNAWRGFCGLSQPRNETELAAVLRNPHLAEKFIKLYGTPDNIDLWVGGVAEPLETNARVGPLLSCIITLQFKNLRDGDRFWWENPGVFTPEQQKALDAASLSRIICDNTHLKEVPKNVFGANQYPQDFVSCNDIPRLSLFSWKKKGLASITSLSSKPAAYLGMMGSVVLLAIMQCL